MTVTTALDHDRRVEAGVALLDEKLGRDVWLPRINLDTLDVGGIENCPLAQATQRWYNEALDLVQAQLRDDNDVRAYEDAPSWSEYHGFGILYAHKRDLGSVDFENLTDAWRRKVEALRAESRA